MASRDLGNIGHSNHSWNTNNMYTYIKQTALRIGTLSYKVNMSLNESKYTCKHEYKTVLTFHPARPAWYRQACNKRQLTADNDRHLPAVRAVQWGCQWSLKIMEISAGHVGPAWGNPNLYLDQPQSQKGDASPLETKLTTWYLSETVLHHRIAQLKIRRYALFMHHRYQSCP